MLSEWAGAVAALPPVGELLLKFTALLAIAWGLRPLVGRANVRWQVFYWRGVALTAALMPLVVLLGPTISVPVLEAEPAPVATIEAISLVQLSNIEPRLPEPHNEISMEAVPPVREYEAVSAIEPQPAKRQVSGWSWSKILAVGWLLPVLVLLAGALLRDRRTLRLVRSAEATSVETVRLLSRVASDLGTKRRVRVCVSAEVDSPRVMGIVRPTILLPKTDVDESDLVGILAHEVSHLVSHDLVWSRVFQTLSIGFWFHPLVWGLGRQHLDACERVSDGVAAGYVGDADTYAGILARVALGVIGGRALAGIAMARTPQIKERLLGLAKAVTPLRRRQVVLVGAAGLILLVGVGGVRLVEVRAASTEAISRANEQTEAKDDGGSEAAKLTGEMISVCGEVVDEDGQPMAGATVYLREWSNYRYSMNPGVKRGQDVLAKAETNERGEFRFVDVPARSMGRYANPKETPWDVVCQHEGFGTAWEHLPARQSDVPLRLRLLPEVPIEGEVLDQSGNPIEDAHVEVSRISPLGSDWIPDRRSPSTLDLSASELAPRGKTDAKGRVLLKGLPGNLRMTLVITHDDFSREVVYVATTDTSQPSVSLPGRGPERETRPTFSRQFSVNMKPAGPTVRGQVTLTDTGEPCANAQVCVSGANRYRYTMTDDDGYYILRDAFVPCEQVSASRMATSDYLGRRVPIELKETDKEKVVDIALPRGQVVTGKISVEETGKAVAGAEVLFQSVDPESPLDVTGVRAVSDEGANFRIVVPEGPSRLRICGTVDGCLLPRIASQADPEDTRYFRDIKVVAGQPVEPVHFRVSRGKVVAGSVTDREGKPVSGAKVRSLRNHDVGRHREQETTTDASGRFELGGFESLAKLRLVIIDEARARGAQIEIDEPDEKATVEISLQPTATFTGMVLVDGKPQANVSINLQQSIRDGERREELFHQNVRTDGDGRYRLERIIPGTGYTVIVMPEEFTYANLWDLVAKAGETLELDPMEVMSRTASVSGIVVDPDGNPVEGVTVIADLRSGGSLSNAFTRTPTGKDGRFSIGNLPDEPLTLVAYIRPAAGSGARSIRSSRVDIEPNQTRPACGSCSIRSL